MIELLAGSFCFEVFVQDVDLVSLLESRSLCPFLIVMFGHLDVRELDVFFESFVHPFDFFGRELC